MLMSRADDSDSAAVRKAKATARQNAARSAMGWGKTIAILVREAGISPETVVSSMPGYGPLIEDASMAMRIPGLFARSIWQMVRA